MPTLKKALSQSSGLDQELLDDGKTQEMIVTNSGSMDTDKLEYQKPAYFAVGMVLALTAFTIFLPLFVTSNILGLDVDVYKLIPVPPCQDKCSIVLVESIPDNLTYPEGSPKHLSIFEGWQNLIRIANKSIDIASFYWTMRGVDIYSDPSDWQGEMIFNELLKAGTERGIKIRIVQSEPQGSSTGNDTETLVEEGGLIWYHHFEGHCYTINDTTTMQLESRAQGDEVLRRFANKLVSSALYQKISCKYLEDSSGVLVGSVAEGCCIPTLRHTCTRKKKKVPTAPLR